MMRWTLSLLAGLALSAALSVSANAREIVIENDCERFAFVLYVHYFDSETGNWETRDYLFPHWSYGETVYLTKETSAFKTRAVGYRANSDLFSRAKHRMDQIRLGGKRPFRDE